MKGGTEKTLPRSVKFAVLFFCIAGYLHSLRFPIGIDQGIFLNVSNAILRGDLPYADVWDIKPPIVFYTYLFGCICGNEQALLIRLLDFFSYALSLVLVWRIAAKYFDEIAAVLSSVSFLFLYSLGGFWHTAQPESFSIPFLLLVADLQLRPSAGEERPASYFPAEFLTGILVAVVFLYKLPSILFGLLPIIILLKRIKEFKITGLITRFIAIYCGFLTGLVLLVGWLFLTKAGSEWIAISTKFLPRYSTMSGNRVFYIFSEEILTSRAFLVSAAVVIFSSIVAARKKFLLNAPWMLILAGAWLGLLIVFIQGKAFGYHFYLFIPFLSLLAGAIISDIIKTAFARLSISFRLIPWATVILALMMLFLHARMLIVSGYLFIPDIVLADERQYMRRIASRTSLYPLMDVLATADYLNASAESSDPVFLWGMQAELYVYAKRYPPTRFIYNLPLLAVYESEEYRDELMTDLTWTPPIYICVEKGDINQEITGQRKDSRAFLKEFPALKNLIQSDFYMERTIGAFDLYRRKP